MNSISATKLQKPIAVLTVISPSKEKPIIDLNAIAAFCQKYGVKKFSFFGSILRSDFDENSDIDVVIDPGEHQVGFHETCRMEDDLEALFGRRVDILTTSEVISERLNIHRRTSILSSMREIYNDDET